MRLLVHVEGQTEESFVNEVIAPYLIGCGYRSVAARLLGNARLRVNRGGIRSWQATKTEIVRHLLEDRGAIATTMVDYYGLPSGNDGWPGRADSSALQYGARAALIEERLLDDVRTDAGDLLANRFSPYVMMHEFEGLLFSDCGGFAFSIGCEHKLNELQEIRNQFETPEHINDSPLTAPSKRLERLIPGYQKTLHGIIGACGVGLAAIRQECRGFDRWLSGLEERVA